MLEMITTKTPIPNTTPIPLADGRGSDAHIFRSLALAVMFFCIDSMDRNSLIRWFSFSVSLDLIGAEPIAEQGHLHSKKINTHEYIQCDLETSINDVIVFSNKYIFVIFRFIMINE